MDNSTELKFKAGGLLTADQMNSLDARITNLEKNSNTGNGSTITNIDEIKITILKNVYPIGSIYSSFNSTLPKDLFGFGSWEQIKDRFLYAAGDENEAGTLGGEAVHTLTIDEMPKHNHELKVQGTEAAANALTYTNQENRYGAGGTLIQDTGGNQPHNNMPPYLTIYMWQRVQDRFFITGQEYKVEEGMTWADWCNKKEYNTTEFSMTDEGYISYADDYIALNDEKVKGDSLIILDTNYRTIQDRTQ